MRPRTLLSIKKEKKQSTASATKARKGKEQVEDVVFHMPMVLLRFVYEYAEDPYIIKTLLIPILDVRYCQLNDGQVSEEEIKKNVLRFTVPPSLTHADVGKHSAHMRDLQSYVYLRDLQSYVYFNEDEEEGAGRGEGKKGEERGGKKGKESGKKGAETQGRGKGEKSTDRLWNIVCSVSSESFVLDLVKHETAILTIDGKRLTAEEVKNIKIEEHRTSEPHVGVGMHSTRFHHPVWSRVRMSPLHHAIIVPPRLWNHMFAQRPALSFSLAQYVREHLILAAAHRAHALI